MKTIIINGSPRKNGNTRIALETAGEALRRHGVETEFVDVANAAIHGCTSCYGCKKKKNRRCVIDGDSVNRCLDLMIEADGILVGSPVYFAGINGALKCFLDRTFYVAAANGFLFRHKVGAAVVAVRRGGETTAWDQMNKYFAISEMFVPTSVYWNMAFGRDPGEAKQDVEGLQTMRVLGENMAWLLKAVADGGKTLPAPAEPTKMNFIR